jgi:hypothetical protein
MQRCRNGDVCEGVRLARVAQASTAELATDAPTPLQVDCGSAVLQPGDTRDLHISFRPTAAQAYKETIPLQVNGLYTVNVLITGELNARAGLLERAWTPSSLAKTQVPST